MTTDPVPGFLGCWLQPGRLPGIVLRPNWQSNACTGVGHTISRSGSPSSSSWGSTLRPRQAQISPRGLRASVVRPVSNGTVIGYVARSWSLMVALPTTALVERLDRNNRGQLRMSGLLPRLSSCHRVPWGQPPTDRYASANCRIITDWSNRFRQAASALRPMSSTRSRRSSR